MDPGKARRGCGVTVPAYPRTATRMRRDAVAMRRAIQRLADAMRAESNGLPGVAGESVSGLAWEVARLAHCVAADAQEIDRVASMRQDGCRD